MLAFLGLRRRNRYEQIGFRLYGAAVAAARAPFFYRTLGIADTLDGRFDILCLYAFLLIRRLQREPEPGPALAQAVFDAMFSDMDVSLREMGVGDLSVGRRVRAMWEALHGRSMAYEAAMQSGDGAALEAALARNLWRGARPPDGSAAALARLALAQAADLDARAFTALATGEAAFLPPEDAIR